MKRIIGRHKAFLSAFSKCGSITQAAKAAGVDRHQHYAWLQERAGYREAFQDACNEVADNLESEAIRRAHTGVFEPTVHQGQFVYPQKTKVDPKTGEEIVIRARKPFGIVKYSDSLLQFLLKGLRPERYRDRVSAEVTGKDGGPISLEQKQLTKLTDDELAQLISVAEKLTLPGGNPSGTDKTPAE